MMGKLFYELTDEARKAKQRDLIRGMIAYEGYKFQGYYKFKFLELLEFEGHPLVPMYSNWRIIQGIPELRELAYDLLIDAILRSEISFDCLSGVPMGGLWIGYGLSGKDRLDLGHVLMRSEAKTHGLIAKVDGYHHPNSKVLPVEDVTTTAGSGLIHGSDLRANGFRVDAVLSIQSYDLGATATLEKNGMQLVSALWLDTILSEALDAGVPQSKIREIDNYFAVLRRRFA
jgi:orotate phosphoribosyltransferase